MCHFRILDKIRNIIENTDDDRDDIAWSASLSKSSRSWTESVPMYTHALLLAWLFRILSARFAKWSERFRKPAQRVTVLLLWMIENDDCLLWNHCLQRATVLHIVLDLIEFFDYYNTMYDLLSFLSVWYIWNNELSTRFFSYRWCMYLFKEFVQHGFIDALTLFYTS